MKPGMQLICEMHPHEILLQEVGPSKFNSELPDRSSKEGNAVSYKIQSIH